MPKIRFSIRHQLLLLGALAVASIWTGALLQYLHLRHQSQRLAEVRADLHESVRLAALAGKLARERGLSNGYLLDRAGPQADRRLLQQARLETDGGRQPIDATAPVAVPADGRRDAGRRQAALTVQRARIDRRELPADEAFAFYSEQVTAVQDEAARHLRRSMVEVGVPYEHVSHVARASELLAQVRGLSHGVLHRGQLDAVAADALRRPLLLYREAMRLYAQSAPPAALSARAAQVGSPVVDDVLARVDRLLEQHEPAALGTDVAGWWPLATRAVDLLAGAAAAETQSLSTGADAKIAAIETQLRLTVLVLAALGILTLLMVLSTVGRIVRGIGLLIGGLDAVASGRNFDARIAAGRPDEFGAISSEVNKLITIASSVLREQAALALVDPLTRVMNRRGFDEQLLARTRADRKQPTYLSVLMIDADHFKSVNDTLGHAAGDAVLKGLAGRLRDRLRADDVLARYGGEEFVAILPNCRAAEALRVADNLRLAIRDHDFGIGRRVTVSIGVAEWRSWQPADGLVARADAALYRAKAAGRDRALGEEASVQSAAEAL